jgi:predicted RNA-binding Zn-ribbon protein involved in translation (DUF1610 family)
MTDTMKCPWCAEEILAEAKKCKHCGEFLTDDNPSQGDTEAGPAQNVESEVSDVAEVQPVWKHGGKLWRCVAHDKAICNDCRKLAKPPTHGTVGQVFPDPDMEGQSGWQRAQDLANTGRRKKLSAAGERTDHGLACPKCGGTQFTAKRSKMGKTIGFATLGVGGLVAPKSQVKCVACGTMFKRG